MKVFYYPCYKNANPYQNELRHYLKKSGISYSGLKKEDFHLYSQKSKDHKILHVHWIEPLATGKNILHAIFKTAQSFIRILRLRLKGIKIVWTLHNVAPHENPYPLLTNLNNRFFAFISEKIFVHNEKSFDIALKVFKAPREKLLLLPHPHYESVFYRKKNRVLSKEVRRLEQESHRFTFIFLGMLRPYKGLEELFDAFFGACVENARFLVIGKTLDKEFEKKLKRYALRDERVTLITKHIRDEEIPFVMNLADVAVLPYREILTSGSLSLMQTFRLPVILPNLDSFQQLSKSQSALFFEAANVASLRETLEYAFQNREKMPDLGEKLWNQTAKWGFREFSKEHVNIFQSLRSMK